MIVKTPATETSWIDPDDAPELTGDEIDRPDTVWSIGGKQVSPEEGKAAFRQLMANKRQINRVRRDSNAINTESVAVSIL